MSNSTRLEYAVCGITTVAILADSAYASPGAFLRFEITQMISAGKFGELQASIKVERLLPRPEISTAVCKRFTCRHRQSIRQDHFREPQHGRCDRPFLLSGSALFL